MSLRGYWLSGFLMTDENDNSLAFLYRPAVVAAVAAGVLCLAVTAVMLVDRAYLVAADPLNSPALAAMKQTLVEHPDDAALREEIRRLDLQMREAYTARRTRIDNGRYVLAGGVAMLLLSLVLAAAAKKTPPMPQRVGQGPAKVDRTGGLAKWAVGAVAVCFGAVAVLAGRGTPAPPWQGQPLPAQGGAIDAGVASAGNTALQNAAGNTSTQTATSVPAPRLLGQWPMFRGPRGQGIASVKNLPTEWDGPGNKNIAWKAPVPLSAASSPVVWNDRVFVTGAASDGSVLGLCCFDGVDGRLLWKREFKSQAKPPEDAAPPAEQTGFAAASPAVDGKHVFAFFATGDLVAYDLAGNKAWSKNLGWPDNTYGHASSLVVFGDLLILQLDQKTGGALYAFKCDSGEQAWKTDRSVKDSWTVPLIARMGDKDVIVTVGRPTLNVYDLQGEQLWYAQWLDSSQSQAEPAPSPAVAGGMVLAATAFANAVGVPLAGKDDMTDKIAWRTDKDLPNIASLLAVGDNVWMLSEQGKLTCLAAKTASVVFTHEFEGAFEASPILADGRVYMVDTNGTCLVLEAGSKYKQLAVNKLGEAVHATPAFIDGRIYIRGEKNLYCIGIAEAK